MSKVFISRPDGNVAWGFRLQGGFEYNEPLTLTNIMPNSPADGKIDPGDMLIEIAGNNVIHMTHKDVLELIQRCGDALLLTVYKVGHSYPSSTNPTWKYAGQQQQSSYGYDHSLPRSSMPVANIPQAPLFDADLIANTIASLKNRQSIDDSHTSYEQSMEFSNLPAVLAKSLSRAGGPKPFTYTPGGLNLSKIRESASIRRSNSNVTQNMNRRMIVPPERMNQHHYAGTNPIQPFSYARQQPTTPRKSIQHDTDVVTQSRAFQMLEGWISDSEKTISALKPSDRSAVSQAVYDEQNPIDRRVSSGGITSLPSRSFRYLQEQYNDDNNNSPPPVKTTIEERITSSTGLRRGSDGHTPSRSFKYLQDQYNTSDQLPVNRAQTVNNREDLAEIYTKLPPSFRAREPEAARYTGSTIPSRSFRFLQMMTQDDQQNDSQSLPGYTRPQQSLLNKYDEQNLSTNTNRLNEHPSRSFRYLQTMTGEQKPTERRIGSYNSTDIGTSDF